jgi:uncharacterized membrane protein
MTATDSRNKNRLADLASLGFASGSLLASALVYSRLPERFPIHFDLHGNVDGFASRPVGAFLMPVVALATWAFVRSVPRFLTGEARVRALSSPLPLVSALVSFLFAGVHFVMLDVALSGSARAGALLGLVLALFSVGIGLVLPKLRRNGYAGIRTPYSLASDENWQKTHRLGGLLFVIAGVVGLVAVPFGSTSVAVGALIAASLASAIYSFTLGKTVSR